MEICREEDISGLPTKEEVGCREGKRTRKKGLFFYLGSRAGRGFVLDPGQQNIWTRVSRSANTFPLINCILSFFLN
jgi:hypothetical protein